MSLLDDVSIVVTPNGYKAGELYAVIPVPTEGAEEVTNGDFATDTDWIKAPSGVTISGGSANFNSASDTYVYQDILTTTKTYKIIFSGTINSGSLYIGENGVATNIYTAGTYTNEVAYFTVASSVRFIIRRTGTGTLDATIDNVSVKEYTSADMDVTRATAATRVDENGLVNYAEVIGGEEVTNGDFATDSDWGEIYGGEIVSNQMVLDCGVTANAYTDQFNPIAYSIGKTYKITVEIVSNTTGVALSLYPATNAPITSTLTIGDIAGTHTATFTPNYTSGTGKRIVLRALSSTGTLVIDNVSVKEVTRDNVPRIDYTGGGCPHILAEPQRTNLIPYSSNFNQWTNSGVTLTPNYGVSVDGTNNATRFKISAGSRGVIYNSVAVTVGQSYTISFYVKSLNGIQKIRIGADGGCVNPQGAETFNVNTEWQRISTTITSNYNPWNYYIDNVESGILCTGTYLETDILIYGAQLEEGLYPTSLIPTNGEAGGVTRNQDIFTRDGIGSLINSTEGVLFLEVAALSNDGTFRLISITDGSINNRVSFIYNTVSNSIRVMVVSTTIVFDTSNSVTSTLDFHKIAIKWKLNDFAVWIDGVEVATDTSGNAPVGLDRIVFNVGDGGLEYFGKVKQLQVYDTALTDVQLAALTS